jgi:acyl dehydratase
MSVWQLSEGETLPMTFEMGPISRTDIVRYQGASGDFQPIHHDEGFAQAAGYDAPLVVGMYPAGALSLWAAQLFGADSVRSVRVRWTAMVWPGDRLIGSGVIASHQGERRTIELNLRNQAGTSVLICTMVFVHPPPN